MTGENMRLNEIRDNKGARVSRVRVGRGVGSGLGKTAGRGYKGQKARTGVSINGFEGGQMPLTRRLPKRGFNPLVRKTTSVVNVGDIQRAIESGHLNEKEKITLSDLQAAGLVRKNKENVRLLGDGVLSSKIEIEVASSSGKARAIIEKVGGIIHITQEKKVVISDASAEKKKSLKNKAPQEKASTKDSSNKD